MIFCLNFKQKQNILPAPHVRLQLTKLSKRINISTNGIRLHTVIAGPHSSPPVALKVY